ncbi:MAG: hypothetical protein RIR18_2343 [Pseudomonadota bacterium]|jgi:prepilin-type N-terminal cleavage/methylation domain-containing protein
MTANPRTKYMAGFSLIELSIVLIIVSLLASNLLPNLQQQRQQQAIQLSQQKLETAREALMAYALLNGNLPCPDWQTNPSDSNYGLAADSCINSPSEGWLPFRTLGLAEGDGWFGLLPGSQAGRIVYRVDPAFTRSFSQRISLNTTFISNLSVVDFSGNKLTSEVERPIAILISSGPDGQLNGENASFELDSQIPRYESHPQTAGFDDLLIWLGRPSLYGVLVKGGANL